MMLHIRVFKAYLDSDPKIIVALKNMWLDDDQAEEGVLLEETRVAMKETQSNEFQCPGDKDSSKHFLTVHAYGRVRVANGDNDHTRL